MKAHIRSWWKSLTVFAVVLFVPAYSDMAEAGVTLKGYTDNGGAYEYVLFGRYPQEWIRSASPLAGGAANIDWIEVDSGRDRYAYPARFSIDPIVWRVLSADPFTGGKALLLSEKNLDAMAFYPENYGSRQLDNNYANSQVRAFLVSGDTSGFYTSAHFNASEKAAISADSLMTADGKGRGETTTANPIFLLSDVQLQKTAYGFTGGTGVDDNRIGKNTGYLASKNAMYEADAADVWLTRSPVSGQAGRVWHVHTNGSLHTLPAAEGGRTSNPYVLYVDRIDRDPVSASVNGDKLTVTFDSADGVVHAYTDAPSGTKLAERFAVHAGDRACAVLSADVTGDDVTLYLARPISPAETPVTVRYTHTAGCSDGLAFTPAAADGRRALGTFASQSIQVKTR